ncbi:MAG: phosphate ABC transporter permease subunit PstC [Oscillochloris sp.]|nr:phosphate ABC transporter permease subunit PstC [Oscillochloris sp.]
MAGAAAAVVLLLLLIGATLLLRAWPILRQGGLGAMLGGALWQPSRGHFGFLPFIIGSTLVTLLAMLVAVPPAVLSGVYLAEYAGRRARGLLKPVVDLLAGVPPVVYGLWGILVIVPFVRDHLAPMVDATFGPALPWLRNSNPSGYGLLTAGLVLGAMVFPLIVAVVDEVLRAAPAGLREALYALGATRWEVARHLLLRAALPGVIAAVVLGFSRAFGETLAVLMVIGNVPKIPATLFDGAYTLSGLIANNYGEMMSVPLYESALMSAACALLAVVVCFNVGARLAIRAITRRG